MVPVSTVRSRQVADAQPPNILWGWLSPLVGPRTEKVFRRPSLVQMALRVSVLAFLGPVVGPRWVRATCALYSPSPGLCRAHACPAQSALSPSWPARSSRRPDVLPIFLRACVWVFPGHVRVLSKSVCGLFVPDSRLDTCCPYVEASAISRRPPRRPGITYWSACTQCTLFCPGLRHCSPGRSSANTPPRCGLHVPSACAAKRSF